MTVNFSISHPIVGMKTVFMNAAEPIERVRKVLPAVVDEFQRRSNKPGQFQNWPDLPKEQLRRVDKIYDMVRTLKGQTDAKVLTVLGIGGSKHTIEHMLGINGLNIKGDKVKFYSDIDSVSFNRYLQELDGNIKNSNFLVVSKSGSTFETKDGMMRVMNKFRESIEDSEIFSIAANREISKHMVAVTDKNPEKSELRRLSNENKWLGDLYIHDDVGGRFSALDDQGLFVLAYAGMKKEDMIKMLQGAQDVTNIAKDRNFLRNTPLAQAAFWAGSRLIGIKDSVHQLLGSMFNPSAVWNTQMQNESLKDSTRQITKITDAMHHSSEAWYNPKNKYAFALTAPVDKGAASENVKGYIDAVQKANAQSGPAFVETFETTELGLTPESAGALTQSRAFTTVFQGMIERLANGIKLSEEEALPEVLQPNVEFYKRNLKPAEGHRPPVVAGRISFNA